MSEAALRGSDAGALLDRFATAYGAHDLPAVGALYALDATHREIAQGRTAHGREAIVSGLSGLLEAFPEAQWEDRERICDGGRAVWLYRLTGTLRGPLGPFLPAGQRLELEGAMVLWIRDERVTASEDFWDAGSFARQMRS